MSKIASKTIYKVSWRPVNYKPLTIEQGREFDEWKKKNWTLWCNTDMDWTNSDVPQEACDLLNAENPPHVVFEVGKEMKIGFLKRI